MNEVRWALDMAGFRGLTAQAAVEFVQRSKHVSCPQCARISYAINNWVSKSIVAWVLCARQLRLHKDVTGLISRTLKTALLCMPLYPADEKGDRRKRQRK